MTLRTVFLICILGPLVDADEIPRIVGEISLGQSKLARTKLDNDSPYKVKSQRIDNTTKLRFRQIHPPIPQEAEGNKESEQAINDTQLEGPKNAPQPVVSHSFYTVANTLDPINIRELSDQEVIEEVENHLENLSDKQKNEIVREVYQEKRTELFLALMEIRELPTAPFLTKTPNTDLKHLITIEILKSDHLWTIPLITGASGFNSLYHQSLKICHTVIDPFFQHREIDWTGNLTNERRLLIAKNFEEILIEQEGFAPSKKIEEKRESSGNENKNSRIQKNHNPESTEENHTGKGKLFFFGALLIAGIFLSYRHARTLISRKHSQ